MTTDDLLILCQARGFRVTLSETGEPVLRGDKRQVTDTLLKVLKLHRSWIIARLQNRRIVFLREDSEQVVCYCQPGQEKARVQELRQTHPDTVIGVEWRNARNEWTRYLIVGAGTCLPSGASSPALAGSI